MAEIEGEVKKWGNSYGIRLSKRVAEEEGLKPGDQVHVTLRRVVQPNPGFYGLGKRYPALNSRSWQQFKREEGRIERVSERRKAL